MSPITIADVSRITGPLTSISPLTAPAITALVAEILPMITELCPILTLPSLTISPVTFAPSANTSEALELPKMLPVTFNLPRTSILPVMLPTTSMEPSDVISWIFIDDVNSIFC